MEMQVLSPPLAPPAVHGPVRLRWLRVLFALVVREMSTRFGRSWGGYLWAIVEPVGGILLLTFIFSLALRKPPLGTNFALFYASGMVPVLPVQQGRGLGRRRRSTRTAACSPIRWSSRSTRSSPSSSPTS